MPHPRTAVFIVCAMALGGVAGMGQQSPTPEADLLHQLDAAYTALFEQVAPSVVIIKAERKPSPGEDQNQTFEFNFHAPDGSNPMPTPSVRSEGSGFIVRPDGYIYTNFHVIEDSAGIEVILRDHRRYPARLVGADERTDIAVLKIDAGAPLPAVTLADSDAVKMGQTCFAIGIPYDLDYSFCRGIVSGKGRGNLTSTDAKPMYEDYIQTDAFINPGNSGGPLFDVDGRVIGMNTLINGVGRGLSFAIPASMLEDVGPALIATGHVTHPWLGISVKALDRELDDDPIAAVRFRGATEGVCVETIEANAPAYKSDLRPKDLITSVDGIPVLNPNDLQRQILRKKVGQTVKLGVWRAGSALSIALVTDPLPADLSKVAETHAKTAKIHPSDATSYGLQFNGAGSGEGSGAPVSAIVFDSPAQRAGLRPGDVITAIDKNPVPGTAVGLALLQAHRGPMGPDILYTRKGRRNHTVLDSEGAQGAPGAPPPTPTMQ